MQAGGWGEGVSSKIPGMLVTPNNSDSLQTITLADADNMAVLVQLRIPQSLICRATVFGTRTECQSFKHLYDKDPVMNCTGFLSSFPPCNGPVNASTTKPSPGRRVHTLHSINQLSLERPM